MTYTTEQVKLSARKLDKVIAARCGECYSFRYNNYEVEYSQGVKPVCDNCITKLRNMQVIVLVSNNLKAGSRLSPTKEKVVKPHKETKPRIVCTEHNIKTGINNAQKILDYIKASPIPLTKKEVYEYIKLSEAGTRLHLNNLVAKGLLCKSESFKPCYIDKDREHLLSTRLFKRKDKAIQCPLEDPLVSGKYIRKKTLAIREKILDYIKQSDCPLTSLQVSEGLSYSYRWAVTRLSELRDGGFLVCLERKEFLWIDSERERLLQSYKDEPACNKYAKSILLELLNTSPEPMRITDLCSEIEARRGKGNRNQLYDYIKYLESQGLVRGEYKQTGVQGTYYGLTSRPEIIQQLNEIECNSTRNRIIKCLKLGGMGRRDLVIKLNETLPVGEQSVFHELRRMERDGLVVKTQLNRRYPAIYTLNDIIE